jgi:hypothetical protein
MREALQHDPMRWGGSSALEVVQRTASSGVVAAEEVAAAEVVAAQPPHTPQVLLRAKQRISTSCRHPLSSKWIILSLDQRALRHIGASYSAGHDRVGEGEGKGIGPIRARQTPSLQV